MNEMPTRLFSSLGRYVRGLILALVTTFKPNTAPTLAVPYALFEGAFLVVFLLYFN